MKESLGYLAITLTFSALIVAGVKTVRFCMRKSSRDNFPTPTPPEIPYTEAAFQEWQAACRKNLVALIRSLAIWFSPFLAGIMMVVTGCVGLLLIATGAVRIV